MKKGTTTAAARSPQPAGVGGYVNSVQGDYQGDTIFDDQPDINPVPITIRGRQYQFVPYGADNQLPYEVISHVRGNMVTAQCQAFNILACYGQGLRYVEEASGKPTANAEARAFADENDLQSAFLEQATDMQYFYFSVIVVILSRDGKRIVQARHKDAAHIRFEYAPSTKSRKIEHVFYGDWRLGKYDEGAIEAIPLLDIHNPLGDLRSRMQGDHNRKADRGRKFAVACRMATPGMQYYPLPYWFSIFRDKWFDIYRLIGIGKRHMIKNTAAPRVQIEIHNDYWDNVCDMEGIIDEEARVRRKTQEKRNIIDFVTGVENAGKALVSGYYMDPNGKENRMVRINALAQGAAEGGSWSDDMQEAANALCFAFGVHPNLVGATPGKSQMNNSGSDKRELFTLKQATEKPFHDIMARPWRLIAAYNGWQGVRPEVPMLMLTTLDKHTDAEQVTM